VTFSEVPALIGKSSNNEGGPGWRRRNHPA
jgi:hypothetical protein